MAVSSWFSQKIPSLFCFKPTTTDFKPKFSADKYLQNHPHIREKNVRFNTADRTFVELTGAYLNAATSAMEQSVYQFLDETRTIKNSGDNPSFEKLDGILKAIPIVNRYAVLDRALAIAKKNSSKNSSKIIDHLKGKLVGLKPVSFQSSQELKSAESRRPLWKTVLFSSLCVGLVASVVVPSAVQKFSPEDPLSSDLQDGLPKPGFSPHDLSFQNSSQPRELTSPFSDPAVQKFSSEDPLSSDLQDGLPKPGFSPHDLSFQNSSQPRELTSPFSDAYALSAVPKQAFFKPFRIPQIFLGQSSSLFLKTGDAVANQATSFVESDVCPKRECGHQELFPLALKNKVQGNFEQPLNQEIPEFSSNQNEDPGFHRFLRFAPLLTPLIVAVYKIATKEKIIQNEVENRRQRVESSTGAYREEEIRRYSDTLNQDLKTALKTVRACKIATPLLAGTSLCSSWSFSASFSNYFGTSVLSGMISILIDQFFSSQSTIKVCEESQKVIKGIEDQWAVEKRIKAAKDQRDFERQYPKAKTHNWDEIKGEWVKKRC